MDAVHKANSGHLGLPLGCAEIGAALWAPPCNTIRKTRSGSTATALFCPPDTVRCSCIRGSTSRATICLPKTWRTSPVRFKNARPPEFHETDGVEATTGPLGQGVGNAVGYALSAKRAQTLYNTAHAKILDYHVVCLCGDGCLQEGVALEAVTFAGHNGLDNLILIFDANGVTLDAMAESRSRKTKPKNSRRSNGTFTRLTATI